MSIDKAKVQAFHADVKVALAGLAAKHGLELKPFGMRYDANEVTFSVKAQVQGYTVPVEVQAAKAGLPAEWIGHEFENSGTKYRVTGFNPDAPKNALKIERLADGKKFRCPIGFARLKDPHALPPGFGREGKEFE